MLPMTLPAPTYRLPRGHVDLDVVDVNSPATELDLGLAGLFLEVHIDPVGTSMNQRESIPTATTGKELLHPPSNRYFMF